MSICARARYSCTFGRNIFLPSDHRSALMINFAERITLRLTLRLTNLYYLYTMVGGFSMIGLDSIELGELHVNR